MKSYSWSWVGRMREGWFGERFDVVRRDEAESQRGADESFNTKSSPKITVPAGVEKRLLSNIRSDGGKFVIAFTKLEDGTVITTAALKLRGRYYMGQARESRPHEFCEPRAKIVALGRAWKAAKNGWKDGDGAFTDVLFDERLCRIAGPVDIIELPDYLLQKADRKRY